MILTALQIQEFLKNGDYMGIRRDTFVQIQNEGIYTITDLVDFDKDTINKISDNLRRTSGRIEDPNLGATAGDIIPTSTFVIGAKSQNHILTACELMRYYKTTRSPLTTGNIAWNPIMRNIVEQWKKLKNRKYGEEPEVTRI